MRKILLEALEGRGKHAYRAAQTRLRRGRFRLRLAAIQLEKRKASD